MKSTVFSAIVLVLTLFTYISQALPISSKDLAKRAPQYQIQLKSETAFCSFLPPSPGADVGATENDGKPFCTDSSLGGQTFPSGFIKSAHFLKTSAYAQVTGRIDRSKYKLKATDGGGQYDNKDVAPTTCNGYKYFVNLIEPDNNTFCIRCCKNQADCKLGISTYGCQRIVPGNYN